MTRTRWIILVFWLFVGAMLMRQCQSKTVQMEQAEAEHPRDGHYFFTPPLTNAAPRQFAPPSGGADVRQTAFITHVNTPGPGSFTCDVTVVNQGQHAATNIQVHVRPYRGVNYGSDTLGHVHFGMLKENDPLSQYGQWVTFPDLKPGDSATESAIFLNHPNVNPGANGNPEINFQAAP